jgi:hypothetical protein
VPEPSALDRARQPSSDAFAVALAQTNNWNVENLARSGATIPAGLLGPQVFSTDLSAPAQLATAKRAVGLKAIFVSVGANDVDQDALVQLCAASTSCDSAASTAYVQSGLHQFSQPYLQLLGQLGSVPGHPQVVINQYHDPFAWTETGRPRSSKRSSSNAWPT